MESDEDCPPNLVGVEELEPTVLTPDKPMKSEAVRPTAEVPPQSSDNTLSTAPAPGAVPVTIVTGFLGAGKTTLLNYILTQKHGRRIAVIENEVGDSMDIEALIAKDGADGSMLADNLFELKNGCICCTVKDDLVTTLEALLERRNKFDYIIIETTGLANPGPVASVFWLDDALESALRLDAIVTLVDAKNITRQLRRGPDGESGEGELGGGGQGQEERRQGPRNEAAMQVAYADRILVNKTDLVSTEDVDSIVAQVRAINAVAEVRCTKRSTVDLAWVLDTRCFSPDLALAVDPALAPTPKSPSVAIDSTKEQVTSNNHTPTEAGNGGHQHDHHVHRNGCVDCARSAQGGQEGGHDGGTSCSVHDPAVTTCTVDLSGSLELCRLERWLGGLLWDPPPGGTEIYRVKGVVSVEGRRERFVVQGVADLFEVTPTRVSGSAWRDGESRRCKIVFIGRLLSQQELERGVESCMA